MSKLKTRRCACGMTYDVFEHNGEATRMDDDGPAVCPKCEGAEYADVITPGRGIDLGDVGGAGKLYPYFDRGLGRQVNSARHRRAICKAKGLVPAETRENGQVEDFLKAEAAHNARMAEIERDFRRVEEDPVYGDFRRLRDNGYVDAMTRRMAEGRR